MASVLTCCLVSTYFFSRYRSQSVRNSVRLSYIILVSISYFKEAKLILIWAQRSIVLPGYQKEKIKICQRNHVFLYIEYCSHNLINAYFLSSYLRIVLNCTRAKLLIGRLLLYLGLAVISMHPINSTEPS